MQKRSPGHAGKEGPQLARTGASRGFSQGAVPGWGFSGDRTGSSGRLLWCHGSQVSMDEARGSASLLSSHVGESSLKTLRRRTLERGEERKEGIKPNKDLESPSPTRLEALVPSRDSRARKRSPSASPSASQLLAFSRGKEQAAGVWWTCLASESPLVH